MKKRINKFIGITLLSIMATGGIMTVTTSKAKANVNANSYMGECGRAEDGVCCTAGNVCYCMR